MWEWQSLRTDRNSVFLFFFYFLLFIFFFILLPVINIYWKSDEKPDGYIHVVSVLLRRPRNGEGIENGATHLKRNPDLDLVFFYLIFLNFRLKGGENLLCTHNSGYCTHTHSPLKKIIIFVRWTIRGESDLWIGEKNRKRKSFDKEEENENSEKKISWVKCCNVDDIT